MTHRDFVDEHGRTWHVWKTIPSSAERRVGGERRQKVSARAGGEDRRSGLDRRVTGAMRVQVTPGYENGWLTFESAIEKRRLAPVPHGWEHFTDQKLASLCTDARPVPKRGRLIE